MRHCLTSHAVLSSNGKSRHDRGEILDAVPPNADESEKALLSSILYRGGIDADVNLAAYEFRDPRNQAIYEVLIGLAGEGMRIDEASFLMMLKQHRGWRQDGLDEVYAIDDIARAGGSIDRQVWHAEQIHEAYIRRTVKHHAERLLQKAHLPGDLAELQGSIQTLLEFVSSNQAGKNLVGPIEYPALTCADLMATVYVVRYYVNRILAAGQPLIFAGPKKSLKTTLLVALMLALATGVPFLGIFEVFSAVAVGMMTGESGMATIQETIHRIAVAMGIDPATITNLVVTDKVPQLGELRHLEAMRAFITKFSLKVLIIDPAYMAMSGADAGNLFVQGQVLRGISELCQELGCTLVLCHHTKRNTGRETYDPPELEDIAWAGFQEWARQWILVGRREPYEPGSGVHRLWLTAGGSVGHGSRWGIDISEGTRETPGGRFWEIGVTEARDIRDQQAERQEAEKTAKADAVIEANCQKIKSAMARFSNGETLKQIRIAAGLNPTKFGSAIARLHERCEIVPCTLIKPNRKAPYEGYRLRDQ